MDNVMLFNDYRELEQALAQLADTDNYTVKQVVAEPDWYREDYALAMQYDGFRFDYDLNYTPTNDLKNCCNSRRLEQTKIGCKTNRIVL